MGKKTLQGLPEVLGHKAFIPGSELTATSPKARRDLPRGSWKPVGGGALLRAGTSQTLTKPQEEGQGGGGGGDGARQHLESWEAAWG